MSEDPGPRRSPVRGGLVEFVRLIFVVLFSIAGFEIAIHVHPVTTGRTVVGIVLGAASGYVLGGVLGRQTASAVSQVEREFARASAAEIGRASCRERV